MYKLKAGLCVLQFYFINQSRLKSNKTPLSKIWQNFLNVQVKTGSVPAVTGLRVFLNVLTAVSILGVDFPAFPRRYAKAETYGTGVMDIGVGCFIFGNALVCPEARTQARDTQSNSQKVKKQILTVWPLVFLGLARLISVKMVGYHEHVSEYGVHWNFFFTLAIVRVLSSLLLTFVRSQQIWLVAAIIISSYQFFLEVSNLRVFILNGSDGQGARDGFLNANREGVFSIIGYVGIYLIGVQVGLYVLKTRMFVKEWIMPICNIAMIASVLLLSLFVLQIYLEPVSRRIANLPFCLWIAGQCMSWLCLILICDLILLLAKYISPGSNVLSTWNIHLFTESHSRRDTDRKLAKRDVPFCLIEAINRNQLLFFLVSNIITGMVNIIVDTIHSSSLFSIFVLEMYMFINCFTVSILHVNNITVKFW
ncbi:phosphatidylinositol-glycan biosynthesis class W protein-like [Gastrophryne carolinensis]